MRKNRRVRAFTLLEVLIVIVIIGLLAAFVAPNFFNTGDRAKEDLARAAVNSGLGGSLNMFRAHVGVFPPSDQGGLQLLLQKPDDEDMAAKWSGPYLQRASDLKDAWGRDYIYESPGQYNTEGFDLSSAGKDGQPGTQDDITNWERT
ncbi:MAG: type II secretion system major pseudopilin GspG [Phycisphaerales bacterium]|nr:type II secretion system major pseudopilin GspG [Phycisphaerales bacterium]